MSIMDVSVGRRGWLAGAGALALGLTACGGRSSSPAPARDATVDVRFEGGTVTVPARPRRVVVVEGRGDLEFALLAGFPLVGVRNSVDPGERPGGQYAGLVDDDVVVLSGGEDRPDPEEVAALAPDLVVVRANSWRLDSFGNDALTGIAPVLPVEVNVPDFRRAMDTQLPQFVSASAAGAALADYDAAVAEGQAVVQTVAQALGSRPRAALMSTQMAGSGSVRQWTHRLATTVATDLGLEVMGLDLADEEGERELSLEEIGQVSDADVVFHQTPEPAPVAGIPTWEALPAVAAGRAFVLDPALNNGLAITATAIARRMTDALRA